VTTFGPECGNPDSSRPELFTHRSAPLIGPIIGGVLGALLYDRFMARSKPPARSLTEEIGPKM
jgi:hypothetical protein